MNTAISLKSVKKTLGTREVLKGITLTVERGDIFGYLGPNGAGKTTTIRILLGLLQANSGIMEIMGQNIDESETRKKIGFTLDPDGLYDNMTGEENLEFFTQIYRLVNAKQKITELLRAVGLSGREKDRVGTYSKGMRQRLALARAMVHDPEVLILDEPTAGVDPSGQIEVRQIMLDLAHKENKTVFLSSHNLDEVQRICNRIALIDRGEIKLYGETDSLRRGMGGDTVVIEMTGEVPQTLLDELKNQPQLGLREKQEKRLIFSPQDGIEVSDIISWLSERRVKIEGAVRKEATLEDMYASILKEAE